MRIIFRLLIMIVAVPIVTFVSFAQSNDQTQIVFKNVRVFDGTSDQLTGTVEVLVEGNKIKEISANASRNAAKNATVIDGSGRVLMPGLSDTHTHVMFASLPEAALMFGEPNFNVIYATKDAEAMLMRGITTIRDLSGNTFGLKKAIDEGLVPGPRIYPSGGMISQTAGHGDFRLPNQEHPAYTGEWPALYQQGHGYLADGPTEVIRAARENLRNGASQIKLATGGGYSSPADPLLGIQYTYEEVKAAVDAAKNWGTYVTIHSYFPESINMAIDAGIKDVAHGQLLDKATLERMAKEGVFLSTQAFTLCSEPQNSEFSNEKLAIVCVGTKKMYQWASEIPDLKVTWGTDMFFVPRDQFDGQVKQMERLTPWFKPAEILKMATGNAGELYKMSGPLMNPYPGELGVIKEGAYADMLLVEGNPLEKLEAVTNTDNLLIIMKDGKIYKNSLN
ncbi:amidohydrolase family protein [Algoriphagus namhaensis]|uniref:Amidohydrolase family protein n=1 Tax=Algoriphagus namhaensis TaxID=915353 RepID=A0ABV8AXS7_9BACT